MSLLVFDIGGSAVKYGVWDNEEIVEKGSFITPSTWEDMKTSLFQVKQKFAEEFKINGVAISSPGAVNQRRGVVEGASAVPYLHDFEIYPVLTELFGCPISMENDANCAALAELWKGAAKGLKDIIFVVVGTGIGGSVIVDGKIHHGKHLFGGEFGYMLLNHDETFSTLASPVKMAARYADRINLPSGKINGKEVFDLAEQGDKIAIEETEKFYYSLAQGIYNLQYSYDPEKIIIGGGVSAKPDLISQLNQKFKEILDKVQIAKIMPDIAICKFKNDANLIGAVYNYQLNHGVCE